MVVGESMKLKDGRKNTLSMGTRITCLHYLAKKGEKCLVLFGNGNDVVNPGKKTILR